MTVQAARFQRLQLTVDRPAEVALDAFAALDSPTDNRERSRDSGIRRLRARSEVWRATKAGAEGSTRRPAISGTAASRRPARRRRHARRAATGAVVRRHVRRLR